MVDTLQHIAIMITEKCNLNCYHCFRHVSHQKSNLNLDILSEFSKKIKKTSITSVRITGGEPLLINNIDEIIKSFSQLGLRTSIGTNGTLLNLAKIIQFKSVGLDAIWITVHSLNETEHDKLAGKKGAYKLMLENINHCVSVGLNINVNFPVSEHNLSMASETLKFLDELKINRIKLLRLTPIGKASTINGFNHISDIQWINLSKELKKIPFQNTDFKMQGCPPDNLEDGRCTVYPFKHMNLSPSGNIYPCCLLNNRKNMEIGHISELLRGNWIETINLFNQRIKQKFDLNINPVPCISKNEVGFNKKLVCPLFSKKI